MRILRIFLGDLELEFVLCGDGQDPVLNEIGNVVGGRELKFAGPGPLRNGCEEVLSFLDIGKIWN